MASIDDKIRGVIGNLILQNLILEDKVERLTEKVEELTKKLSDKPKEE